MAPVTLQRFVKELDKLKHETDAGRLKAHDYHGRLARITRELRERGLETLIGPPPRRRSQMRSSAESSRLP